MNCVTVELKLVSWDTIVLIKVVVEETVVVAVAVVLIVAGLVLRKDEQNLSAEGTARRAVTTTPTALQFTARGSRTSCGTALTRSGRKKNGVDNISVVMNNTSVQLYLCSTSGFSFRRPRSSLNPGIQS